MYGIRTFTIGFGDGADAALLQAIANCSNASFYWGHNYTEILELYQEVASEIANLASASYNASQTLYSLNISSVLFGDSYIKYVYEYTVPQLTYGEIPLYFESEKFNNQISEKTFYLGSNMRLVDLKTTSYSSDYWTSLVKTNNPNYSYAYSLDTYGANYSRLGDPFIINIPPEQIIYDTNNIITVKTGYSSQNLIGGSYDNKLIYSVRVNTVSGYTDVYPLASGCKWLLDYEDGTNGTLNVPSDYAGNSTCIFRTGDYDPSDAINQAAVKLFSSLDFDSDGILDLKIAENQLTTSTIAISKIPTMYGPSVFEVRVWY